MKLLLPCFQCLINEPNKNPVMVIGNLTDKMTVHTTCPNGHKFIALVQNARFEILFESASLALIDGYHREADASFSAALERFYEFYIRVSLHRTGIDHVEFEKTWKMIANKSERQLGAFVFTYLQQTGKAFYLTDNLQTFRNRVLHEGYIPSLPEVHNYAEKILTLIEEIFHTIPIQELNAVGDIISKDLHERIRELPDNVLRITHGGMMVLDVTCKRDINSRTLQQRLDKLKEYRDSLMTAARNV